MLTIVDNDVSLAFSAPTYSVKESAGTATITVELAGVNSTPVIVTWATSDGTALAGSDYGTAGNLTPPTGMLTFPAGGTPTTVRTKTFPVRIIQDRVIEATETVNLTLSSPSPGAQLIAGRDTAVLSIVDDDTGGVMQFSAATYTVGELAGNASIIITRTGSTAGGATVDYATSDGTGVAGTDDATTTGTAIFAIGQNSLTFPVPILDNATPDGVRTVNLTLSNPGPNAHRPRWGALHRSAEDRRQRAVAGLQRPQLFGARERGVRDDHGRADRGERRPGDRRLGLQRWLGDGRPRLRDPRERARRHR